MASLTLKNIKKIYPHNGDDAKKNKKKKKGGKEVAFNFGGNNCHVFNKETGINLEA